MVKLKETRRKTKDDECKKGSTLKTRNDDKINKIEGEDKIKTSNMIKSTNILKARAGWRHELEGSDREGEIESVMVVTTPSSKEVSEKEARDGGVEQPVGGCCFGKELEGDRPHDFGAVEDDSLQE